VKSAPAGPRLRRPRSDRAPRRRRDDPALALKLGGHARAVASGSSAGLARNRSGPSSRAQDGAWRKLGYREALGLVRPRRRRMLDRGLDGSRPVVDPLGQLRRSRAFSRSGAMHVGVPVAPVLARLLADVEDFAKLKAIFDLLRPAWCGPPIPRSSRLRLPRSARGRRRSTKLLPEKQRRGRRASPHRTRDHLAKILFTSGSTGTPKGVINTRACSPSTRSSTRSSGPSSRTGRRCWSTGCRGTTPSRQQQFRHDAEERPARSISTAAKPLRSHRSHGGNLREVSPTIYFNVPRGFDLLMPFLEKDAAPGGAVFPRPRRMDTPERRSRRTCGAHAAARRRRARCAAPAHFRVGLAETAPMATGVHYAVDRAGIIGLPVPGCELKLLPAAGRLEARVKGPNVNARLLGPRRSHEGRVRRGGLLPHRRRIEVRRSGKTEQGLAFDGRIAEDSSCRPARGCTSVRRA